MLFNFAGPAELLDLLMSVEVYLLRMSAGDALCAWCQAVSEGAARACGDTGLRDEVLERRFGVHRLVVCVRMKQRRCLRTRRRFTLRNLSSATSWAYFDKVGQRVAVIAVQCPADRRAF